ncbi:MAG: hypothetical protein Q9168_003517 [Polycauliona sp. 1 TL-2023]
MAPAPTTRITRSTKKSQPLPDMGKSPPRIAKKTKKPDAASRSYRINADVQNQSDSSEPQAGKASPKIQTRSVRRGKANRLKSTSPQQPTPTREKDVPSRGSKAVDNEPKPKKPRLHVATNTNRSRSRLFDSPTDAGLEAVVRKNIPADAINPFTRRPLYPVNPKRISLENLQHSIINNPHLRFDHTGVENLLAHTQPKTPSEIAQYYHDLRSAAWQWARDAFDYGSSSAPGSNPLDLLNLATTNAELMEHINSTTASPQFTDWEGWIEKRKAAIVYTILGKVIDVHIFAEDLFGASEEWKGQLRREDRLSMDEDGFQRQSRRSHTIYNLLSHPDGLPPSLLPALQALQGQLITLLSPLLPPQASTTTKTNPLFASLFALLLNAANLSIAIRRIPNAIIYFTPAPAPGSKYDDQEMAALNSVDLDTARGVDGVNEMLANSRIRAVVGVGGGWPACEGYWPAAAYADDAGTRKGIMRNTRKQKEKKGEPGIGTQLLAKADVWVILEAVDPHLQGFQPMKTRPTLRTDLWDRSQDILCAPYEKEIARLRTLRYVGFAAAALVAFEYWGMGDRVRNAILGGWGWEEYMVRKRAMWVRDFRRNIDTSVERDIALQDG